MDWSLYRASDMERRLNRIYLQNGIRFPSNMDLDRIAAIFDLEIVRASGPSFACWDNEFGIIFLNEELTVKQERAVFFHELCHPLHHVGNQWDMPRRFLELQETQAQAFQAYAALPFYMLEQYGSHADALMVDALSEDFLLPEDLIRRRLNQIKRRILQEQMDHIQRNQPNGKSFRLSDSYCEESRVPYVCQTA